MPSNTIQVYYSIDGGTSVNHPLSSNLTPGASWNFTFSIKADLSSCGAHIIKVWVSRPGDANQLNDTLRWTVQNDCVVVPGTLFGNKTVCSKQNSEILMLIGQENGTISDWQYSTDNGGDWKSLGIKTNTYIYTNLETSTSYRVLIDGGFCPDATSSIADITTETIETGSISGSTSLPEGSASGQLTLDGASRAVDYWESSTDNGQTWNQIANTTNTLEYELLVKTTWYRASTYGGPCPVAISDTAIVEVIPNPLSIYNDNNIDPIQLYPNPSQKTITISFLDALQTETSITICNIHGKKMMQKNLDINKEITLDIESLESGMYIITMSNYKGTYNIPFIKK